MPRVIAELPGPARTAMPDAGETYSKMAAPDGDKRGVKRRSNRVFPPFRGRAEVEDTFPEDAGPVYSEALDDAYMDEPNGSAGASETRAGERSPNPQPRSDGLPPLLPGAPEPDEPVAPRAASRPPPVTAPMPDSAIKPASEPVPEPEPQPESLPAVQAAPSSVQPGFDPYCEPPAEYPSPEGVENYRARLEERLLERYNSLPDYAGRVGLVRVALSRQLETSIDGKFIRAEFDQLVYDIWGKRLPALEEEYFVVVFGEGGAQRVRSEPSVRVGLDLRGSYSEMAPPIAKPLEKVDPDEAFASPPSVKMPSWWRPEFPELY